MRAPTKSHAKAQSRKVWKADACREDIETTENDIAKIVVDAAYHIHVKLGPGLLESVYEFVLAYELRKRGLTVVRQQPIPVVYDELQFDEGFRADLIVNDLVIIEVKSVEKVHPVHKKQLLTYLRLADRRLGLLINFGETLIKDGISRIANNLRDESNR
ncbi:MAG: GxxExxY protein [Pirellulaceae bacterium]|nr:GxxExxY protein [Pirellulaceae bacterium]